MPLRPSLVALTFFAAACAVPGGSPGTTGGSPSGSPTSPAVVPYIVSSELAQGKERFLFTLVDRTNQRLSSPDVAVHVRFFDLARSEDRPVSETDATFYWAIPETSGLYRAPVVFDAAGTWAAEVRMERIALPGASPAALPSPDPLASPLTVRITFDVRDHPSTPAVGAPAPHADVVLHKPDGEPWSTDEAPDPRLYAVTIDEALTAKRPFLLIFATPAFCRTAMCGPTLDTVKQVLADFPTLTAIHVEPYQLADENGTLQPVLDSSGNLQPVPAVTAWGLVTEPYTLLVDANGNVAAKLEGPIDATELRDAINALASP